MNKQQCKEIQEMARKTFEDEGKTYLNDPSKWVDEEGAMCYIGAISHQLNPGMIMRIDLDLWEMLGKTRRFFESHGVTTEQYYHIYDLNIDKSWQNINQYLESLVAEDES